MMNVYLLNQQRRGNFSIYLWLCFWSPDEYKSNIHSTFSSVFGLHQLPRKAL